jgi:translation initiation factor RLI1
MAQKVAWEAEGLDIFNSSLAVTYTVTVDTLPVAVKGRIKDIIEKVGQNAKIACCLDRRCLRKVRERGTL